VADFYAGSGTSAEVCEKMGRKWIICDSSKIAVQTSKHRLIRNGVQAFKLEGIENNLGPDKKEIECSLQQPLIYEKEKDYCILLLGIDSYKLLGELSEAPDASIASLIDFWEVDLDYQGGVFNSDVQIIRENYNYHNSSIPLEARVRIPRGKRKIGVRIHDILGNSSLGIIEIKI
jgi:hypothetical protein